MEPKKRLGMIADDLTGACDTGVKFALRGLQVVVALSPAPDSIRLPEADLLALSTDTRSAALETARRRTREACLWLQRQGASLFYKKIDSVLRGNIGAEIAAALEMSRCPFAVVAPAFPAMGRRMRGGKLYLGDSREPSADLLERLAAQGVSGAARIGLSEIRRGGASLVCAMQRLYARGRRVLTADAGTDEDLRRIAEAIAACQPAPLPVGSAGLAMAMAERWAASGMSEEPLPETDGCAMAFIGTRHPVTTEQVSRLAAGSGRLIALDERAPAAARNALKAGETPIFRVRWKRAEEPVIRALCALCREHPVRGLILSGGDTAAHVCRLLGAQAILLRGEAENGIPWGRLIGGEAAGLAVCAKSGGFGKPESLLRAAAFLCRQVSPPTGVTVSSSTPERSGNV